MVECEVLFGRATGTSPRLNWGLCGMTAGGGQFSWRLMSGSPATWRPRRPTVTHTAYAHCTRHCTVLILVRATVRVAVRATVRVTVRATTSVPYAVLRPSLYGTLWHRKATAVQLYPLPLLTRLPLFYGPLPTVRGRRLYAHPLWASAHSRSFPFCGWAISDARV